METIINLIKSLRPHSYYPGDLHDDEARIAATKFDYEELALLRMTWQDLADRCNGKGIDKETFLQYFPLNGLLGERLYLQFDRKKMGFIDFDHFIIGLSTICRGSQDEKIHFIFNMYDISHDQSISKQEMTTLINQIPKSILMKYASSYQDEHPQGALGSIEETHDAKDDEIAEVDAYTNHDVIMKAFEDCDIHHQGRLNYEEFKMWLERNPAIIDYIESIVPYHQHKEFHSPLNKNDVLPRQSYLSRGNGINLIPTY